MSEDKRYGVIVADPPWMYGGMTLPGHSIHHYDSLSTEQIAGINVADFAARDCILLLWSTWVQLPRAFTVGRGWGFEYVSGFPWVKATEMKPSLWDGLQAKVQYGMGWWVRGCSEALLIWRRGKVSPPTGHFMGLFSPNTYHSRKPNHIYEYAESLPGPYLEMFARRRWPGWDVWGEGIESDIVLEVPK